MTRETVKCQAQGQRGGAFPARSPSRPAAPSVRTRRRLQVTRGAGGVPGGRVWVWGADALPRHLWGLLRPSTRCKAMALGGAGLQGS